MLIGKKRKKRSIARKWKGGWWGGLTDTCYCRLWNIEKTRRLLLVCVWCWRVLMALEHNKTTTKGGALPLFWWTCVLEVDQHEPMLRSKPPTLEFIEDEMARVALRTGWNFWLSVVTDKRRAAAKQRTTVRLVVATTWIDTGWLIRLRRPSGADLDNNLLFFFYLVTIIKEDEKEKKEKTMIMTTVKKKKKRWRWHNPRWGIERTRATTSRGDEDRSRFPTRKSMTIKMPRYVT